jgi:FkbM family methyltransferase
MKTSDTNQERTAEYLKSFNRERILKHLIPQSSPVLLDVGANVGQTLEEFKTCWPESSLHCFEPQQECWESLEAQAKRFGQKGCTINKFAVGSKNSTDETFYSHDINSEISGFNKINLESLDSIHLKNLKESDENKVEEYKKTINFERKVDVMRMDSYLKEKGIDHINLLKIDTQGFEMEVLSGMGPMLENVDVVVTELMFFDYYEKSLSFSDLEKFLIPAGLHLYDINHIAKNPMNGRTDWVDVIYVNKKLRSKK